MSPEQIIGTTWHSLSVWDSPEMTRLRELIQTHLIEALFVYDPDRLPSKPAHRLLLRALCHENGVLIKACHSQVPEGEMGEVFEFISAWQKQAQVHRAQQGARDGLRDRVKLRGLPPVYAKPYGYQWSADHTRLQPTAAWPVVNSIFQWGLQEWTVRKIVRHLFHLGIKSPSGKDYWAVPVVHGMLSHPVYGGKYYALRRESRTPKQRKALTYGKSSQRKRPLEEATYLPNITVENPPLTWEQWETLQQHLRRRKELASRHARRSYLLRGRIICARHTRRYHGQPHKPEFRYACPGSYGITGTKCERSYLPGSALEEQVKSACWELLASPDLLNEILGESATRTADTRKSLQQDLQLIERQHAATFETEANVLLETANGRFSENAQARVLGHLGRERERTVAGKGEIIQKLEALNRRGGATTVIAQLRHRLLHKLNQATPQEWDGLFTALDLRIHVSEQGELELCLSVPTVLDGLTPAGPIVFAGPDSC